MQISTEVLNVLSRCRAEGNFLFLADQLDRSIYVKTNKVLEAAGGKVVTTGKDILVTLPAYRFTRDR
ncbi:hypothetical protein OFN60_30320, partial [Escherichia coli]|nr:hypothetical protein [Escherichia coli]